MQLQAEQIQNDGSLDDLFEAASQAAAARPAQVSAAPTPAGAASATQAEVDAFDVFQRIGTITRKLHDALQQLGYDKQIQSAVGSLPDARTRLDYIARLTGDAAEKVLNEVDQAVADHDRVEGSINKLDALLKAGALGAAEKDQAVAAFLDDLRAMQTRQREHLTQIMMAQDFHDLTGQVVRKIVDVASNLEAQLVKLLMDATPPEKRTRADSTWLNGPVVDAAGRSDVVTNQAQVDDLLESLGF
jgi:chemotaxis protein CheZ